MIISVKNSWLLLIEHYSTMSSRNRDFSISKQQFDASVTPLEFVPGNDWKSIWRNENKNDLNLLLKTISFIITIKRSRFFISEITWSNKYVGMYINRIRCPWQQSFVYSFYILWLVFSSAHLCDRNVYGKCCLMFVFVFEIVFRLTIKRIWKVKIWNGVIVHENHLHRMLKYA
jgi:hypothetical protein